jgi:CheY-like chemotaxis protein
MVEVQGCRRILVLEDNLDRVRAFRQRCLERGIVMDYAATAAGCIEQLLTLRHDALFLDHDLGDEVFVDSDSPNCGAEVARWLSCRPEQQPSIIVLHSLNEPGRARMRAYLPNAIEVPFAWTDERFPLEGVSDYDVV